MFTRIVISVFLLLALHSPDLFCAPPYVDPVDFPSVPFKANQSSLSRSQVKQLHEVANTLKNYPELRVFIKGYADSTEGPDAKRVEISERRARVVYDWLAAHGVAAQLKGHRGFGATEPIDLSDTESQRRHNRRVEIRGQ